MIKKNFKYIDLFAGIGGFHQAMRRLGGKCVFACERNEKCNEFYKKNFNKDGNILMHDDVRTINPRDIPKFDVLCAGFPCQPFSKAGYRRGFKDKGRGDLFYSLLPIIDAHPEVKFIILENVRNLADNNANWDVIKEKLMSREFIITEDPIILSPHEFGIPQIRERVYILGIRKDFRNKKKLTNSYIHKDDINIENEMKVCPDNCLSYILDNEVSDDFIISDELTYVINAWDEFKKLTNIKIIGKPIWLDSFGMGIDDTEKFREKINYYDMPNWKQQFVDFNRNHYLKYKKIINDWDNKWKLSKDDNKLHRKFEWNCGVSCKNITEGIIQIRQSGIRVKRPNFFPSLVAMNNTPIIWDKRKNHYRYITPKEAAKLQSFDEVEFLNNKKETYKQLGNSVNVDIIEMLARKLFNLGYWRKRNE